MITRLTLIALCSLLMACDRGVIELQQQQPGPLVVTGSVLDGNGNPLPGAAVIVTVLHAGCAGDAVTAKQANTPLNGIYSTTFERATLPARICIRASADLNPANPDDNNSTQRDSIAVTTDTATLNISYDYSVVSARIDMANAAQVSANSISLRLIAPTEEKTLTGLGSVPSSRLAAGVTATLIASVNAPDRSATISQSLTTQADKTYGFDVIVSPKDPTLTCFGCAGKISAPIRLTNGTATADSLFIIWGWNSISRPVVY